MDESTGGKNSRELDSNDQHVHGEHCDHGHNSGKPDRPEAEGKKGKKKGDKHQSTEEQPSTSASGAPIDIQQIVSLVQSLNTSEMAAGKVAPKNLEDAKKKEYKFWSTQPVPNLEDDIHTNEWIEADKTAEEIRAEPYSLPDGFVWCNVDLGNEEQLKELYILLNENYVEDDDNMFRFDYSASFLDWALHPPGWLPQWHCGVRVAKNMKLVGFISAIPATVKIYDKQKRVVEINFLCVHKRLRNKRVAPVLIREITRRVNQQGIFQAVYTAGVILPKPVARCRYWHRSLNPRKLIDIKFSHLARNMTMQRTLKLYRLPDETKTPGFRMMTAADITGAYTLLAQYLSTFELAPVFTRDEFEYWFLPRPNIIDSFVVETEGKVTAFCSFYHLPSTVVSHPRYKQLKAAYAYYTVPGKTPLKELLLDCLVWAKKHDFDVFNALDLMGNSFVFEDLKFGIGDGNLQYYLYNWKCPMIEPDKVGLVLM